MSEPSRVGRFGGLAKAAKARGELPPEAPLHLEPEPSPAMTEVPEAMPEPAPAPEIPIIPSTTAQEATKRPRRGKAPARAPRPQPGAQASRVERELGKSAREDFRQTTIYVPAETHADAFDKLRAEQRRAKKGEARRDMSDVVGALLAGWVAGRFRI
jgi:hypothetical protein